jgi:hypothetical protein
MNVMDESWHITMALTVSYRWDSLGLAMVAKPIIRLAKASKGSM